MFTGSLSEIESEINVRFDTIFVLRAVDANFIDDATVKLNIFISNQNVF